MKDVSYNPHLCPATCAQFGWLRLWLLFALLWGGMGCQAAELVLPLIATPTAEPSPTPSPTAVGQPTPAPHTPAGFALFAAQANASRNADRQRLVNSYVFSLPHYPLVGEGQAVLIWQGPAQSVGLVGEMNGWQPAQAWPLTRFADTDTWYIQLDLPAGARLDYQFWVDGQRLAPDPLNPITKLRPEGVRHELAMPEYVPPPELASQTAVANPGTITRHTLASELLGQTRTFLVYEPAVPPLNGRYPTLYVNDGSDYLSFGQAARTLDVLIQNEVIEPVVVVFVPPVNRTAEYDQNEVYAAFLAQELVPVVQAQWPVDPTPERTAVLGAGLGGLQAWQTAVYYPTTFGLVAAHSADLARNDEVLTRRLRLQATLPLRVHLVVGLFETAVDGHNVLVANQRMAALLAEKGYEFAYHEEPQGGGWGLWEAQFGQALRYFWGR